MGGGTSRKASRKYGVEESRGGEYEPLSPKPSPATGKSMPKSSVVPGQEKRAAGQIIKGAPGPPLPLLPAQLGDEKSALPPLPVQRRSELSGKSKQSDKGTSQASPVSTGNGKTFAEGLRETSGKSPSPNSKGSRDGKLKVGTVNSGPRKRGSRDTHSAVSEAPFPSRPSSATIQMMRQSEDQMPLPAELQGEDDGKDDMPLSSPSRPVRAPPRSYRRASHENRSEVSAEGDSVHKRSGVLSAGGGRNGSDGQILKFERYPVQVNAVNLKRNSKVQLRPATPQIPPPLPALPVGGFSEPDIKETRSPSRSPSKSEKKSPKDFSELSVACTYMDLS